MFFAISFFVAAGLYLVYHLGAHMFTPEKRWEATKKYYAKKANERGR